MVDNIIDRVVESSPTGMSLKTRSVHVVNGQGDFPKSIFFSGPLGDVAVVKSARLRAGRKRHIRRRACKSSVL